MPKKIFHLTIEHLYYLIQYECYLTFKADGIFKTKEIYDGICEYELLDNGRELVFDYITETNTDCNIMERLDEYCKLFRNRTIKSFEDKADFKKAVKTAFDQLFAITAKQSIFTGKSKEKTIEKKRYRYTEYSLNKDIYNYHLELLKYRECSESEESENAGCLIF